MQPARQQPHHSAAREVQRRYFRLMDANFVESNPTPVKAGMALMGLCESVCRLPLVPLKTENLNKLRGVLESLGLIHQVYAAR